MDFLKSSVRNRSGTIFDLSLPISDSRKILSVMHAVATMGTPHSVRIYYGSMLSQNLRSQRNGIQM